MPLERYLRILRRRSLPGFLRLKRIPVEVTLFDIKNWETLKKAHNEALGTERCTEEVHPNLLDLKVHMGKVALERCELCHWRCGARRMDGEQGFCGVKESRVSSFFLHPGEEPPLVPSLTVFFSGCNFRCVFCQNWDISQRPGVGEYIPPEEMARIIEKLGRRAKNVNWVGGEPTPNIPYILEVLSHLSSPLPIIWNSNMYLTEVSRTLLEGAVDLFLTDFKYFSDDCALRYSKVKNYVEVVKENHLWAEKEGDVLVRHLLLPGHLKCCTYPLIEWVAENLPSAAMNIMDQYRPEYRAGEYPELVRRVTEGEWMKAIEYARGRGVELLL